MGLLVAFVVIAFGATMHRKQDDIIDELKKYLHKVIEVHAFDLLYQGKLRRIDKNLTITLVDQGEEVTLPIERIESFRCLENGMQD